MNRFKLVWLGFYLSSAETNHQVGNEGVLCLSGAMADHHAPAVTLGHLAAEKKKTHIRKTLLGQLRLYLHSWDFGNKACRLCCGHSRLQGLCDGADLVDFKQQAVAGLLGHTLCNALGVGDGEVVAHHLDTGAGGEFGPPLPVILVKGILDGHNCWVGEEKGKRYFQQ